MVNQNIEIKLSLRFRIQHFHSYRCSSGHELIEKSGGCLLLSWHASRIYQSPGCAGQRPIDFHETTNAGDGGLCSSQCEHLPQRDISESLEGTSRFISADLALQKYILRHDVSLLHSHLCSACKIDTFDSTAVTQCKNVIVAHRLQRLMYQ